MQADQPYDDPVDVSEDYGHFNAHLLEFTETMTKSNGARHPGFHSLLSKLKMLLEMDTKTTLLARAVAEGFLMAGAEIEAHNEAFIRRPAFTNLLKGVDVPLLWSDLMVVPATPATSSGAAAPATTTSTRSSSDSPGCRAVWGYLNNLRTLLLNIFDADPGLVSAKVHAELARQAALAPVPAATAPAPAPQSTPFPTLAPSAAPYATVPSFTDAPGVGRPKDSDVSGHSGVHGSGATGTVPDHKTPHPPSTTAADATEGSEAVGSEGYGPQVVGMLGDFLGAPMFKGVFDQNKTTETASGPPNSGTAGSAQTAAPEPVDGKQVGDLVETMSTRLYSIGASIDPGTRRSARETEQTKRKIAETLQSVIRVPGIVLHTDPLQVDRDRELERQEKASADRQRSNSKVEECSMIAHFHKKLIQPTADEQGPLMAIYEQRALVGRHKHAGPTATDPTGCPAYSVTSGGLGGGVCRCRPGVALPAGAALCRASWCGPLAEVCEEFIATVKGKIDTEAYITPFVAFFQRNEAALLGKDPNVFLVEHPEWPLLRTIRMDLIYRSFKSEKDLKVMWKHVLDVCDSLRLYISLSKTGMKPIKRLVQRLLLEGGVSANHTKSRQEASKTMMDAMTGFATRRNLADLQEGCAELAQSSDKTMPIETIMSVLPHDVLRQMGAYEAPTPSAPAGGAGAGAHKAAGAASPTTKPPSDAERMRQLMNVLASTTASASAASPAMPSATGGQKPR